MRRVIAADHNGFTYKTSTVRPLAADGHHVTDLGTSSTAAADYPDYARAVGTAVRDGRADAGVLVCGSGAGVAIAANKLRGIRAALCHDLFTARQSREDDDANVLCLGARVLEEPMAVQVARAWVGAQFSGEERHARRVAKIGQLEAATASALTSPPAPAPAAAPRAAAPPPAAPAPPRPAAATPAPPAPAAAPPGPPPATRTAPAGSRAATPSRPAAPVPPAASK